jgi:L-asparagine transporter-like permease
MTEFVIILLFINFGLFLTSFILILISVLRARNNKKENKEKDSLPKLAKISYGFALLALITMVFISFLLIYQTPS